MGKSTTKTLLLTVLDGVSKNTGAAAAFSDVPTDNWMSLFLKDETLKEFAFSDAGCDVLYNMCKPIVKKSQRALGCLSDNLKLLERNDKSFI